MYTELIKNPNDHELDHADINELIKKVMMLDLCNLKKMELMEYTLYRYKYSKLEKDYDYEHVFCDGIYMRQMKIPAGDLVVGMLHKTEHINLVISGDMFLMTNDKAGNISGYYRFISKPGDKKMLFSETDVIYATVHKYEKGQSYEEIKNATVCNSDLSWVER